VNTVRLYDPREVDYLRLQQTPTMVHGEPVLVKSSPTEPREGYMDHHELAIIREHWIARDAGGDDAPAETAPKTIEDMRDSMGFPNRNLCEVEIHTRFETLRVGNNDVGLWRYYPRASQHEKGRPCLIFLHGGGWVGGTPYTVENFCKLIAERANTVVFNVDYSLAPEKKYPNGFNDCFGVVEHIYRNAEQYGIDPKKIAVGGDSAGGNLTAAIALKDRDLGTGMLAMQVLLYACVVLRTSGVPGYEWKLEEFSISDEQAEIINNCIGIARPTEGSGIIMGDLYLDDAEAQVDEPYVSPLRAKDFSGLPRTLSVACEYDGLCIQDELYAGYLRKAGVPVKSIRYRGVTHAFIDRLGFVPQAEDLCQEIATALREL